VSASACPRCAKTLPDNVLRDVARGTSCPFCAAPLKRSPRRTLDAPPTADEGYATFELDKPIQVNATPPPVSKPEAVAALKAAAVAARPAPVTPLKPGLLKPAVIAAAMPKSTRATMVGAALTARDQPFEGTPALGSFALAAAVPVAPVRGLAPPLPSVRTPTPPASVSAMAATMLATPAASRLPLPGSIPPPPAPPARPTNGLGTVAPVVTVADSEPTTVSPPSPSPSRNGATVRPLVIATDEEPTHVAPGRGEPTPVAPVLGANDSGPIAMVTVMPDSAPIVAPTMLRPVEPPRRGLAMIGIGMGLAIVALVFGGVKLLGGPKAAAPASPAQAAAPAPATEPVAEAMPAPPAAEAPVARTPAVKVPEAKTPAAKSRAPRTPAVAEKEKPTPAEKPVAAKRTSRESVRRAKAHHRTERRAKKVAMASPAAKRSAPAASPERTDPRPAYERGNALLLAGDGKGAIAAYREAVKSSPSDPIGFRGLGLAYEQQGETGAAVRALRRYLKLAPHAADHDLIAKRVDRLAARAKQK
jgi:hypothetical protein